MRRVHLRPRFWPPSPSIGARPSDHLAHAACIGAGDSTLELRNPSRSAVVHPEGGAEGDEPRRRSDRERGGSSSARFRPCTSMTSAVSEFSSSPQHRLRPEPRGKRRTPRTRPLRQERWGEQGRRATRRSRAQATIESRRPASSPRECGFPLPRMSSPPPKRSFERA
jgi:hypothetical protein